MENLVPTEKRGRERLGGEKEGMGVGGTRVLSRDRERGERQGETGEEGREGRG